MSIKDFFTKVICTLLVFSLVILFFGCRENPKTKTKLVETVVPVKLTDTKTSLYYKGILNPISSTSLLSPAEGYVNEIYFKYGETVIKGQKLLTIQATQLGGHYRQALTDYLQKKANVETQAATYEGDQELYKAGAMSRQAFENAHNSYATSVLSLNQSRFNLEKILSQASIDFEKVEALKLEDVKKVNRALQQTFSNFLVKSPANGVVLIPVNTTLSESDPKNTILQSGTQVKKAQPILTLGNPIGYQVKIKVSELKIVDIVPHLPVIITSDAFPKIMLKGYVKDVAVQANPNQSSDGSLSMFDVLINVPNVPAIQRKDIRVGMSVKVKIQIKHASQILVPIEAIFNKNGENMIIVIDPVTKQRKSVPVQTGETTLDKVIIIKGLTPGDKIIVPTKADIHANTS